MAGPRGDLDGWQRIRLIAHRCGGSLAPENSLAGLDAAAALGVRAVEFDAMLSADGVPMLIHDETLERTCEAQGAVSAHTALELGAICCARGWEGRFAAERIPTLAAALRRCQRLALLPNIEIKPSPGHDRATGVAVAQVALTVWGASSGARPLLSSFSETALAAARGILPDWPCALLVEEVPADWRQRMIRLGASDLHCHCGQPDWAWLAEAQACGIAVRCYTVNLPAQAEDLWARGVEAVFTDRIDAMGRKP